MNEPTRNELTLNEVENRKSMNTDEDGPILELITNLRSKRKNDKFKSSFQGNPKDKSLNTN